eukprot:293655-Amphidinium_carterae.1
MSMCALASRKCSTSITVLPSLPLSSLVFPLPLPFFCPLALPLKNAIVWDHCRRSPSSRHAPLH